MTEPEYYNKEFLKEIQQLIQENKELQQKYPTHKQSLNIHLLQLQEIEQEVIKTIQKGEWRK